jgi:NTE family protein
MLDTFTDWQKDRAVYAGCKAILQGACPAREMPDKPPPPLDAYGVYVGFDRLPEKEGQHYLDLPTSFYLPKEEIDKLREIGPLILEQSEDFKRLCSDLKCHE